MATRNSDGTYRSSKGSGQLTERTLKARWVEEMVMKLRVPHLSFSATADEIGRAGRGEAMPAVPLPNAEFPRGYRISEQAAYQACRRALARRPQLTAEEWRQQDQIRCDDAALSLQKKIRAGDAKAIEAWVRLQDHVANVNGYRMPPLARVKAEIAVEGNQLDEARREEHSEVLRAMTDEEARILGDIMDRCRQRVKDRKDRK
jgi:hypothetical protein